MHSKIKLFTDSASDLPQIYKEKFDIGVTPLSVIFGEEVYQDQVTMSAMEFWDRLETSKDLPSTSQVNPHDFIEAFQPFLEEGYQILYIGVSAKLSGTLHSAEMAKDALNTDRIHIFDSKTASLGQSLLLITAAEMLQSGATLEQILARLEKDREESFANFILDSLAHLVRGGRLTKTQGLVGSVLNIKPILQVTRDGEVEAAEKVRSTKKALQTIVAKAKESGIDFSQKRVALVYAKGATNLDDLRALVENELEPREIIEALIGPTVGAHTGPGGLALLY